MLGPARSEFAYRTADDGATASMGKLAQGSCQSASQRLPGDLLIPFSALLFRPDEIVANRRCRRFEIYLVHKGSYSRPPSRTRGA